jgi:hypothetical protein
LFALLAVFLFPSVGGAGSGHGQGSGNGQGGGQKAPTNTALPTISGTAAVGKVLTASTGSWSGNVSSYAYQWRRCDGSGNNCSSLTGAVSVSYVPVSGDVGHALRVSVTASNNGGSSVATSNPTAAVVAPPANTALPTISGSAVVGQTLTASTGTWSGAPTSYAYQWRRCDSTGAGCASISSATSKSYTLQSSDAGRTLRIVVTATNVAGSASATSAQSGVVASSTATTTTTSGYPASFYSGPARTGILLPPNGGYPSKGVWIGEASGGGLTQTYSREQYFGRKFNIVSLYAQNRCDPWPASLADDVAAGYIPMVSWFPTPAYADQIIAGQADSCIRSFGNAIGNQSGRVLVRAYWEFNGGWQPFSKNSNGTRATAAQEKQMWQHTIDVLRTTTFFSKASVVWSVSEGYFNNGDAWNNPTPYPGDSYVDWVASSGYNWNKSTAWCGFHAGWCTFAEAVTHGRYAPAYTPIGVEASFRGKKPYLVGETGSVEDPYTAGRKGQWMTAMGNYIKTYMPGLYALVYFDKPFSGAAWNLDSSTSSMNGFKSFANDPYFKIPTR